MKKLKESRVDINQRIEETAGEIELITKRLDEALGIWRHGAGVQKMQ